MQFQIDFKPIMKSLDHDLSKISFMILFQIILAIKNSNLFVSVQLRRQEIEIIVSKTKII